MPSARCPECDELVGITTTPDAVTKDRHGNPLGTSRRWRVDMHPDRRPGQRCTALDGPGETECPSSTPCPTHGHPLCAASGAKI